MTTLDNLSQKWRLWNLGVRVCDSLWLLKPSLRFHLAKLGIPFNWGGEQKRLRLKAEGHSLILFCRDTSSDAAVIAEMFAQEQYSALSSFQGIRRVLDLGANIGLFAMYVHLFHPGAFIQCVEPEPENLQLLQQNLRENHISSEIRAGAVVADELNRSVTLYRDISSTSHSLCQPSGSVAELTVAALPFSQLLLDDPKIDLIKCDVEGSEGSLFQAAISFLNKQVRYLIVEYHSSDIRRQLLEALSPSYCVHSELNLTSTQGVLNFERRP